jgi:DNA polymerase elongation subunit (family B)
VPAEDLLITQRLSRALDGYKTPSPAAWAARQLVDAGKTVAPGQVMRFVFTRGKPGVWAYGYGEFDKRTLDIEQYTELLERAARTILDSFILEPRRQNDRGKEVLQLITPSVFKGYFS